MLILKKLREGKSRFQLAEKPCHWSIGKSIIFSVLYLFYIFYIINLWVYNRTSKGTSCLRFEDCLIDSTVKYVAVSIAKIPEMIPIFWKISKKKKIFEKTINRRKHILGYIFHNITSFTFDNVAWESLVFFDMILDIDLYLIDRLHIPGLKALFVVALKISRYCD